ncbi:MAG: hypothetical protein VW546_11040, partial [Gammaproteobacteria bacterium]
MIDALIRVSLGFLIGLLMSLAAALFIHSGNLLNKLHYFFGIPIGGWPQAALATATTVSLICLALVSFLLLRHLG